MASSEEFAHFPREMEHNLQALKVRVCEAIFKKGTVVETFRNL